MTAKHHFVPQFYFRNFSERKRTICMLHKNCGKVVLKAPINSQSAKSNFYGSTDIEALLSKLESKHAPILHRIINGNIPFDDDLLTLYEAITVQRLRTEYEESVSLPVMREWYRNVRRHWLKCFLEANPSVVPPPAWKFDEMHGFTSAVDFRLMRLLDAISFSICLADLRVILIRNVSAVPFIFSDSPVVFLNSFCRHVKNRGVLGFQTPGLQVFYPLNHKTMICLFDGAIYRGLRSGQAIVEIPDESGISQLNSLQLHQSHKCIYFGSDNDEEYVHRLWSAHKHNFRSSIGRLFVDPYLLIDGKPIPKDAHALLSVTTQLNVNLNLWFLQCDPIQEVDFVHAPRTPELREAGIKAAFYLDRRFAKFFSAPK